MKHLKKAVIFDLDGTLLNTLDDLADSMNESLKRLGFPTHETDAYRIFVGDGVKMLAKRALPEGEKTDENCEKLLKIYAEVYKANQQNKTKPYEGVESVIKSLKELGFELFVLSNKPDLNTKEIVKHYFGGVFNGVYGQVEAFPKKPDPSYALHILQANGIKPENTIFVGDSSPDILTAKAAKTHSVGVSWGFRGEAELKNAGAEKIVKSSEELLKYITEFEF